MPTFIFSFIEPRLHAWLCSLISGSFFFFPLSLSVMAYALDARDQTAPQLTQWSAPSHVSTHFQSYLVSAYQCEASTTRCPAPNPISMDVIHLQVLKNYSYAVASKFDGSRYHIAVRVNYLNRLEVVLIDRIMRVFQATFARVPKAWGRGTLLDAEWIGGQLYVFDAVMVAGNSLMQYSYPARRSAVSDVIESCSIGFGAYRVSLHMKPIFSVDHAHRLYTQTASDEGIPSDGVVFTPLYCPIKRFTHWTMFKAKRTHTIDLRLVLRPEYNKSVPNLTVSHPMQPMTSTVPKVPKAKTGLLLDHMSKGRARNTSDELNRLRTRKRSAPQRTEPSPNEAYGPLQWLTQLKYAVAGGDEQDATAGFPLGGRTLYFRIHPKDKRFLELLDVIKQRWNDTASSLGEGWKCWMANTIVECSVAIPSFSDQNDSTVWVTFERTRPDKDTPNSIVTITRTIFSIRKGVTADHLAQLKQRAEPTSPSRPQPGTDVALAQSRQALSRMQVETQPPGPHHEGQRQPLQPSHGPRLQMRNGRVCVVG